MNEHPDRNDNTDSQKKPRIPRHLLGDGLALVGGIIIVIVIVTVIIMNNGG